jgi:hypothetical protein
MVLRGSSLVTRIYVLAIASSVAVCVALLVAVLQGHPFDVGTCRIGICRY